MDNSPMELLSKLIGDPEAIKNVKDMLGNTMQDENSQSSGNINFEEMTNVMPLIYEFLNNQQNNEMIKKINKAYGGYTNNATPGLRLLDALKPYLGSKRTENFEKIKQAVRLSNAFSELKK